MARVLKDLPPVSHPDLLVGYSSADDAGVFRLSDTQALVQTVDFFPPIVDDPFQFGQIAAANALSDVYAMGGRPLTALNIVGFPAGSMPEHILADILRGGADKVNEAGAVTVGGHSVKDKELKYGLAITGMVHPDKIVSNAGAKEGDLLFLTKPLGTGVITTGIKRGLVKESIIEQVIQQMARLNRKASELMVKHNVRAATDITGFGLLGHAYEMASASGVTIRLNSKQIPVLDEAVSLAAAGCNPGGAADNRSYLKGKVSVTEGIDPGLEHLLYDPQTSGGLFIAISAEKAEDFSKALTDDGLPSDIIGEIISGGEFSIIVV